MGRRLAGLLALALVGGAGQAAEADGWFSGSKADLGKEELAAEQLRTGAHLKENPLKDGIGLPSNGDDREPQQEFFWFNEVTGEVAWELPVLDHENEEGEVYYVDTKTKEVTWDVPEHWNWHTVHDEESEDSRPYYFNPSLQLAQWEKPEALAWTQKHSSKFFWHNTVTDEVQWETPPDARLKSDEHPGQYYHVVNGEATWESPHGWEVVYDDKYGQEYYRNTKSDESSWVKPVELGWVKVHVDYDHSEL